MGVESSSGEGMWDVGFEGGVGVLGMLVVKASLLEGGALGLERRVGVGEGIGDVRLRGRWWLGG